MQSLWCHEMRKTCSRYKTAKVQMDISETSSILAKHIISANTQSSATAFSKLEKVLNTLLTTGTHARNRVCVSSNCTPQIMTSKLFWCVDAVGAHIYKSKAFHLRFRNLLNGCFWLKSSAVQRLTLKYLKLLFSYNFPPACHFIGQMQNGMELHFPFLLLINFTFAELLPPLCPWRFRLLS